MDKYTLYFKGNNKYDHEHLLPIISGNIRVIDEYLSNYDDYVDLFKCLPSDIQTFIKDNLSKNINCNSNKDLECCFRLINDKLKTSINLIFYKDIDALYVNTTELNKTLVNSLMTFNEYQSAVMRTKNKKEILNKYDFYKYLYDTYVKDKKIKGMIDTYDIKEVIGNVDDDKLYTGALATDKVNILVLSKKLEESICDRRDLAIKIKKLNPDDKLITYAEAKRRKNNNIDKKKMYQDMISNLNKFIKKYNKEYDN